VLLHLLLDVGKKPLIIKPICRNDKKMAGACVSIHWAASILLGLKGDIYFHAAPPIVNIQSHNSSASRQPAADPTAAKTNA